MRALQLFASQPAACEARSKLRPELFAASTSPNSTCRPSSGPRVCASLSASWEADSCARDAAVPRRERDLRTAANGGPRPFALDMELQLQIGTLYPRVQASGS